MKKLLCAFLAMALVILPVGGSMAAYAEDAGTVTVSTYSAGTSFDTAAEISLNTTYSGEFTESEEYHYYKLTPDTAGRINITLTTDTGIDDLCAYLYDESRDCIWSDDFSSEGGITIDETLDLTAGTYYFVVENDYGTGSYDFEISHESANVSFEEEQGGSNNSYSKASAVSVNTQYTGQLAENDDCDWYKVVMSSSGELNITLNTEAKMEYIKCYLYNESRSEIWSDSYYDSSSVISVDQSIDLTAGTYYFVVERYWNSTGVYTFSLPFTSANESFAESQGGSNNGYNMASVISLNTTYTGQLAENDNEDWYKVELTSAGKINITLTTEAGMDAISCYLCDASRTEIWGGGFYRDGSSRITIDETTDTLSAGTYYLRVKCSNFYDNNTGVYTFKLQKASVSQTKAQTITLKSSTSKTIKSKKLKKKAQTFKLKASTSGDGKITYKKVKGNKKIKVSKTGKVTVKKGLKKGKTYKVKVKVTAAKTSTYEKATKTVTLKIKIK